MRNSLFLVAGLLALAGIAIAQSPVGGGSGSPIEASTGVTGDGVCQADIACATHAISTTTGRITAGGGETCGGDLLMSAGSDIANSVALTGDSAGNVGAFVALGTSASPSATTAERQVGGPTIIRGGLGTTALNAFVHANCQAGDAYTISGKDSAGNTITGGLGGAILDVTAGGNWTLGADANGDATGFGAAITGNTYASAYITPVVSTNNVGIRAVPGMLTDLTIALKTEGGGGACGTVVNGADGPVALVAGSIARPPLAAIADLTTGIRIEASQINFSGGGASLGYINTAIWNSVNNIASQGFLAASGDIYCGDDYLPNASSVAGDAAPVITTMTTEEPYAPASPPAARPTNTTGGNLVLAPANGDRRLDNAGANGLCVADPCIYALGQTITIPTQTDGVVTNCVLTSAAATNAATREFLCNGATPANCAAAIVTAASTVSPCSLLTVKAANKVVQFSRVAGSVSYIGQVVPSAAGIVAQNGTAGDLRIGSSEGSVRNMRSGANAPSYSWNAYPTYGLSAEAGYLDFVLDTNKATLSSSGNFVVAGSVTSSTYAVVTANATLGTCAASGDVGKLLSYLKTNITHLCYCKQTGIGTYAWTSVFAGGDCT